MSGAESPINGPVDTAVRILCALDASGPTGATEERLRFLDLFVVFAGDVGGAGNVHPSVSGRLNAWNFRGEFVLDALDLLRRLDVVAEGTDGRWRRTNAPVAPFPDEVPDPYVARLSEAARWLVDCFTREGDGIVRARMLAAIEASGFPVYQGSGDRFAPLRESWQSDLLRLRGINATAVWLLRFARDDGALAREMADVALAAKSELARTAANLRGLNEFVEECMPEPTDPVAVFRLASELTTAESEGIVEALHARHTADGRHYHGWTHVLDMLADLAATMSEDWLQHPNLILAILFHDAVYDPTAADNEAHSADLADVWLGRLPPARRAMVRCLIMATDHRGEPDGAEEELIADLDLAILATSWDRYRRYADDVRREYAHVTEPEWRAGRAAVLRSFLARDRIFRADAFADRESAARINLERELTLL